MAGETERPTHAVILRLSGSKDLQIQGGDRQRWARDGQSQSQSQAKPTCSAGNQAGGVAGSYSDLSL